MRTRSHVEAARSADNVARRLDKPAGSQWVVQAPSRVKSGGVGSTAGATSTRPGLGGGGMLAGEARVASHTGHGRLIGLGERRIGASGVDFGRAELGVAQELTQTRQRHTRFGRLAGKSMPQLVRRQA